MSRTSAAARRALTVAAHARQSSSSSSSSSLRLLSVAPPAAMLATSSSPSAMAFDDADVQRREGSAIRTRTFASSSSVAAAGVGSSAARRHLGPSRRYLSVSSSFGGGGSSASSAASTITLRKLTSPFLLLCHPDRTPLVGSSALDPSASSARETNLRAVQTLNGLVDAAEIIYDRAAHPFGKAATSRGGSKVEFPRAVEIEFLVPSDASLSSKGVGGVKKFKSKHGNRTLTRRSVVLRFPPKLLERTTLVDASTGRYDLNAARELRRRMGSELVRLCRAAGCGTPDGYREWAARNGGSGGTAAATRRSEEEYEYGAGDLLAEELDLDGSRRERFGSASSPRFSSSSGSARPRRRQPLSKYERSRDRFVRSVDWTRQRQKFDRDFDAAIADLATHGTVSGNDELRGALISTVLGKVRIDAAVPGAGADEGKGGADSSEERRKEGAAAASMEGAGNVGEEEDGDGEAQAAAAANGADANDGEGSSQSSSAKAKDSDSSAEQPKPSPAPPPTAAELDSLGLGPVGQLIALRRLSLLLEDNFNALEMEAQGRMWENLTIVLTPQRDIPDVAMGEGGSGVQQRAVPRPLRRRKGTVRESGFKFTYGGDVAAEEEDDYSTAMADDAVTARIPVDFTDDELMREFQHHLGEYWIMCGPGGGGSGGGRGAASDGDNFLDDFLPRYMRENAVRDKQ